ncbi:transcriptional regulator, TetR family [Rhizobiales bacterium GAS191]|jgi:AcrR family transcriptional regulator|nr:transcriptional regulator, TetR family [Rhizobiales bacterium GAS113]SEC31065.1 transcriptional regulator, TetR family [Rhizobiales bacterium GAS191]SEC93942.1 transcriptional regulator, TetR family [Rhizobiales bacterium GAS188]
METGISAEVSRGRPRDAAKREAILAAAYELVLRHGYVKVTTAQIASAAGAGKQTIYRWWPTKAELVLDALEHWAEHSIDLPAKGAPLRDFLARVCDGAMRAGRVLRSLMAEAQFDDELRALVKRRLIEPRRDALRESLRAMGMEAADDRETLMRAIYGALWYRLLLDEPLDEAFIDAMTDLAERSLRC